MKESSRWRVLGPGGGGAQFFPAVSPHDPRVVLVACDMTGAYITHDAGQSWRMINLRTTVSAFAFDPSSPGTIYAVAQGLWRSDDAGKGWSLVWPDPAAVQGILVAGDHGEVSLEMRGGRTDERLAAFAVDPADPKALYAVLARDGGSALHRSDDRGRRWQRLADLEEGGVRIFIDPRSPKSDRTLYVVGRRAVQIREGGAWSQGKTPVGVRELREVALGFPRGDGPPTAYAISSGKAYVSRDGGRSWDESPLPGEGSLIALAACANYPETAYLSYRNLRLGAERFFGVMKTSDRGGSWEPVWKENNRPAENVKDIWLTERFGPYFAESPFSLGVAPNNPDLCYGTDWARTMRTDDGGKSWQPLYSRRLPDGSYTSTGLDVTTCYGLDVDPFDPRRLFLSYTDIGLFRSENGGEGWVSATIGVPRAWVNTTYAVAFDPQAKGRMWAAVSQVHDLPRPKMWRNRPVTGYKGGICRSDDGGRTWRVAGGSLPETAATHLLLDPDSPAEARTLYMTGFGRGVFKSVDGGESWQPKNAGIDGETPFAWRLARDGRGTLYLIVARRSEDGRIGTPEDGALYRSTDGAQRWVRMALPPGVNGPNGLAIDPEDPMRLYLAAWSRPVDGRPVGGGVFVSVDGGASWKQSLDRDQHVYDVTIDPRDPRRLYACGFSSSAWRSDNRGRTWRRLPGYNFKWGHRVVPDPQDAGRIYVTTFGGSLWHGPADGDPKATEDIIAPASLRYPPA